MSHHELLEQMVREDLLLNRMLATNNHLSKLEYVKWWLLWKLWCLYYKVIKE